MEKFEEKSGVGIDEFVALVETMRELQKDYFRVRANNILVKAKKAEREGDKVIAACHGVYEPEQATLIGG